MRYPTPARSGTALRPGIIGHFVRCRARRLLDELRALACVYADDAAVRQQLARGLFNTLIDAKAEDDLARRDALLDELRALAQAFPDDPAVRHPLARGQFISSQALEQLRRLGCQGALAKPLPGNWLAKRSMRRSWRGTRGSGGFDCHW